MEGFDDDDFGELYAVDVEVPTAIPEEQEEVEEKTNVNDNTVNVDLTANDDCAAASDSDDDDGLKIVLNDEDFPPGLVACDNDGDAGDDNNGSRFFHPKSERNRGSSFVNNMKAHAAMGMASYISSLNKGRSSGYACIQNLALSSSRVCLAANPMAFQCGYGSVLPWYWGIFDVNIDTLTDKPWKAPGVDITDYFNFDFNERTWKLYCASLEQLYKKSLQTGFSVDASSKWNQEAMREQTDEVLSGSGNVLFPSSDCGLPKGRAIQVEDSMVERQPSIDVRRPRHRDFNVIEIKLLESSDDYSGSGNSTVMDVSLERESMVMSGNKRNILNSSSECNEVLSEDQLEDLKRADDSSVKKRSGQIPGVDGDEHQDQADQHSEDAAEVPERGIETEEGGGLEAYPCWIESELSLGDVEHSLTSYTDSDSEATENSVHVDNDKSLCPLKRKSLNCVTDMKESLPLYWKNSKNYTINIKAENVAYKSRTRVQCRKEWRLQRGGYEPGYNTNNHTENDNDVSSILQSSARDLSLLARRPDDYGRHKDQLQVFSSHKRNVSYNRRETKQSYYYEGEKVADELVSRRSKYYHEDRETFRDNNQYDRKNEDVGDYFFEPGPQFANSEDRERDWYHVGSGYFSDDLSPGSDRESRQFLPKHSSFADKGRDTQRKRMYEKSRFRDRNCIDDSDECEFEFLNKSYRMSTSAAVREKESVDNNREEQFPHIYRGGRRSVHRGRHCDSPPLILNNVCFGLMEVEDHCQKYTNYQTSNFKYRRQSYTDSMKNYAYGARVKGNFGGWGRDKHARDNRGSNWSCDYTDTVEDEDFPIYPLEEYQFYRSPLKFLNWREDEIICRHHETHATSFCSKEQSDDIPLQQHQLSISKRDAEKYFEGSSKIMPRSKGGQAVLRCRKSVDLINGEGKSQVRSTGILHNGRPENVNQGIAKKWRASVGFDESNKNASKFDTRKYKSYQESKKWVQNLQDQGHKEGSDIEEGQIVTELYMEEASVSRRDASLAVNKRRMSQNENSSEQCIGGYDCQRILDSLAKMKKRRERFKQPITMKKEESLKLNNDSIVDTGEMKQHRPARKRRWVGN